MAKLQNESKSCWSNLSTLVAATINLFSYNKKLIAAATVKIPYFDNSASKIIFFTKNEHARYF